MSSHHDRIRQHTAQDVLRRLDADTESHLRALADAPPEQSARRLGELAHEWDTDRVLETEAATMGLVGLALGLALDRRLLAVPALVAAAMLTHALTGRYPLMPLFRRLGVRTASEVARERHAVKALRGDFDQMGQASADAERAGTAEMPNPLRHADLH
ncbi:hypothetical protein [Aquabacterium fontiphilum]|jgi:sirohydrochlorin ferrochelatase|uniref:hypothetical protein n=1 Tax=Aquabacterium fontiphilum TaxID=450365 RepID=UPI00191C3C39|nr:hypothetical protein [Aquabacterium fontiphilum]